MKKSKSKNEKYKELYKRFSNNKDYGKMTLRVRKKFNINLKKPQKLPVKKYAKFEDEVYELIFTLIPDFMHPEGDFIYSCVETYILLGKKGIEKFLEENTFHNYGVRIMHNLNSAYLSKFKERHKDGVFVYISPHANKKSFIDSWGEVKKEITTNKKQRRLLNLKPKPKRERDKLIYNLYTQTRKQLGLKRGEFKEIKVANILKTKHNIIIEPEALKMAVSRYKDSLR